LRIISLIRKKYKKTPVQITTNGTLLSEEIVKSMEELRHIELNLSVNCIDDEKRRTILGLKRQDSIRNKIELLKDRINFSASAVLVPGIIDACDIEEMLAFLSAAGASSIRLYIQGYTREAKSGFDFDKVYEETSNILKSLRPKYEIPVVLEPSYIDDLDCRIEGIIKGSPAHSSGMKEGDVIIKVDGSEVRSRVDGFNSVFRKKNPRVRIKRGAEVIELALMKQKSSSPGFIVLYDIDPDITLDINKLVSRYKAGNVLFMTSELAFNVLAGLFKTSEFTFDYEILRVKNLFFGGSIKCAGLLTAEDIIAAAKEYLSRGKRPDLIVLPPVMFDYKGRDLVGRNIKEIENELGINVDIP
ncbi:MAG: DUF512 domain-containing protein, partial [Bacillota bacterium]